MKLDHVVKTDKDKAFLKSIKDDKLKALKIPLLMNKLCKSCRRKMIKRTQRNKKMNLENFCSDCVKVWEEGGLI